MRIVCLHNFRRGLATNSSSTHSLIYRNDGEVLKDLDIFELNYYDRCTKTIAASKEAKIKYILADIMYDEQLVDIMCSFYPQMKEYFPFIKEQMEHTIEDVFGMYARGALSFSNNIPASVDYLRHVIESDDIIIVGGSDEEDFVWETTENHVRCPDPSDIYSFGGDERRGVTKNGNYWVGFGYTSEDDTDYIKNSWDGRLRFSTVETDELIPEYPELIDLKITNMCGHGCPMCFMGSTPDGEHADIDFLTGVISGLGEKNTEKFHLTEFSIGGGNVLAYPHLEELFSFIHERGHIINITIKANDCNRVLKDENIRNIIWKYVSGIGVSVFNIDDAKKLINFFGEMKKTKHLKQIVAHMIPEYIGANMTKNILDYIRSNKIFIEVLFLGYKTNGRGSTQSFKVFNDGELNTLLNDRNYISVDTTFANRYIDWIKSHMSYRKTLTLNEGEFSMYIDGIKKAAYKSSYQLDKPYNMAFVPYSERENNPMYSVKEAFGEIRRDGGFKVYDENAKHYYDV